jgi:hypothetical protein
MIVGKTIIPKRLKVSLKYLFGVFDNHFFLNSFGKSELEILIDKACNGVFKLEVT